jgi:hypothetical protein
VPPLPVQVSRGSEIAGEDMVFGEVEGSVVVLKEMTGDIVFIV